jgi:hypothetical protein
MLLGRKGSFISLAVWRGVDMMAELGKGLLVKRLIALGLAVGWIAFAALLGSAGWLYSAPPVLRLGSYSVAYECNSLSTQMNEYSYPGVRGVPQAKAINEYLKGNNLATGGQVGASAVVNRVWEDLTSECQDVRLNRQTMVLGLISFAIMVLMVTLRGHVVLGRLVSSNSVSNVTDEVNASGSSE